MQLGRGPQQQKWPAPLAQSDGLSCRCELCQALLLLLGVPGSGRGSRCRRLTLEVRDLAVVRVVGGEPGAVAVEAREGAGEPGGSPAGVLASVGGVE